MPVELSQNDSFVKLLVHLALSLPTFSVILELGHVEVTAES